MHALAQNELDADEVSLLGRRVGNYTVERRLARGGMGDVFLARHPALGTEVAVKFLSPELARDPALHERFLQEARITATLRHPNIVATYDFGEIDGRTYYVMELLRGEDLAHYTARVGRLGYEEVVGFLEQLCNALDAAHTAGIVHRDLKPTNVFVAEGPTPTLKLMDFGVAKVLGGRNGGGTHHGQIIGTPTHMAPEQALGEVDRVTPQSDLYSLGVIGYELLTGCPPFEHESPLMLLTMHIRDPLPPLRDRDPTVPERVAAMIEWCLAKDPEQRPRSARQLATRLVAARQVARSLAKRGDGSPRDTSASTVDKHTAEPATPEKRQLAANGTLAGSGILPALAAASDDADVVIVQERYAGREVSQAVGVPLPESRGSGSQPEPVLELPRVVRAAESSLQVEPAAERSLPVEPAADSVLELFESPMSLVSFESNPAPSTMAGGAVDEMVHAKLLRRMERKGDFPAFVRNVNEITVKADADREFSARQVGDSILRDFALTAKLMRTVNSVFGQRFGGKVYSLQQAIVLLGFDRVRTLALGISVFKNGATKAKRGSPEAAQSDRVTDAAVSSLVSGELAARLARRAGVDDVELAQLCAMFRHLGHHLVLQHLPDEYEQILTLARESKLAPAVAAQRVIGTTFEKLGVSVASRWELPKPVLDSMLTGPLETNVPRDMDRVGALSLLANELTELAAARAGESARERVLQRHQRLVKLTGADVDELLAGARESFDTRYAELFGDELPKSRFLRAVPRSGGEAGAAILNAQVPVAKRPEANHALLDERTAAIAAEVERRMPAEELLKRAIADLREALGLRRVLLMGSRQDRNELSVLAASGEESAALAMNLTLQLGSGDVFASALASARDAIVQDAYSTTNQKRVPLRYYEVIGSASFALYVCVNQGDPVRLLLIDAATPELLPSATDLARAKTLRQLLARLAARA